ncbi:FGGY carbohydrate kinase domain-containing protein isoform X3 [Oncorhynchus keta]|uniref:FGGY carbohydrate kinase domain-containing protein isoform X3 n=1 Tax=Oncorhynchus keta TaxID=8018 RepID=UPI0015FD5F5E|nr:FGGY carbohydrate kinase domain-containing protein isoform X3 [Oncorhynchus keta]
MAGSDPVEWYYVGVDVGTASVRAALVTREGQVKTTAEEMVTIWKPHSDHYVQSSTDIWAKCCSTVRKVTQGVQRNQVRGVGFDATCSLVVLDQNFKPVAVNQDGEAERNVVMWMDHRAAEQAARITSTGHRVLSRVGGVMSPEMQPPKLLWLKENLRATCWRDAAHFLDLPDFLSWKATASLARSLCTVVCKWTYCPTEKWDTSFWTAIGLEDLLENNNFKIGSVTCCPGSPVGEGLTQEAAAELGLDTGTAVGASLIDAHAGGLGVIGADVRGFSLPCEDQPITSRMAMICGTSSCHMAISQGPLFVPGVWGPYMSGMVPELWLNEGGQSATGRLIDHVVKGHVAYPQLQEQAVKGSAIYSNLGTQHILEAMTQAGHDITTLFLCGGLSKNPLYVQIHANATGLPLVLPAQTEAVLVGAAVLGACASHDYSSILEAMEKMAKVGKVVQPDHELWSFYRKKYSVFLRLHVHQREYMALMND